MIKEKEDMEKMLKEAEFGFDKKNALNFGTEIFDSLIDIFGKNVEDLKFELDKKGYFADIYNEYSGIENPTKSDLNLLKGAFINRIKEVTTEIESVFHKYLDKLKNGKYRIDRIKKFIDK
jgi:hypothetical protein